MNFVRLIVAGSFKSSLAFLICLSISRWSLAKRLAENSQINSPYFTVGIRTVRPSRRLSLALMSDAAMISAENILALTKSKLHYIVGARTFKAPLKAIRAIHAQVSR